MVGETIHVVDGDGAVRSALGRLFRSAGYDVLLHASLGELVGHLPDTSAVCAVVDASAEVDNGSALFRALHRVAPRMQVIYLTTGDSREAGEQARHMGAVAWLTKPVDATVLLAATRRALAGTAPDRPIRSSRR